MLKKISLIAIFAMMSFCGQAQEEPKEDKPSKFGFTSGYINSDFHKERFNYAPDENFDPVPGLAGSGLFLGVTFDTEFNENFGLSSELIFADIKETQFQLAAMVKYNLFQTGLHVLAGPEITFINSGALDHDSFDYGKKLGVNLTGGLEYDINTRISFNGKYSYELTDRYKGGIYASQYKGGFNSFRLGLKFRF